MCDLNFKTTENHNIIIKTNTSQHVKFFHSLIFILMCSPFYYHSERVPGDGEDDSDDYVDVDEDDVIDNLDDDYKSGSDGGNYWFTFILIILSHKGYSSDVSKHK